MDEDEEFMSFMLTRGKGGGGGGISGCMAQLTLWAIIGACVIVGIAGCTSGSFHFTILAIVVAVYIISKW